MQNKNQSSDWQILLHEWVARSMGKTGITLPFLVGALALKRGKQFASETDVRELINAITNNPIQGHYVGIRRCQNIQAPVLSLLSLDDPLLRQCEVYSPDGQLSIAFSPDAMSSISGLNCDNGSDCIEKLISYTTPHTTIGNFSRQLETQSGTFIYMRPTQAELEFIKTTLT